VKDAKGQAIKGADVRVDSKDGKQQFNTVKTDAKGRYISEGLPVGVFRVTLIVNGAVKASVTNTKTKADQKESTWSGCQRPREAISAVDGSKFPMARLSPVR